MKKLKKFLLLTIVFALLANTATVSKAARKVVSFDSIEGSGYTFDNVKSIKLSNNKVIITGTLNRILPNGNYKKTTQKKFTFRISEKIKKYECEDEWYYDGKVKKSAFIKAGKTSIKTKKTEGYHFPCVYFWTKNGKIVSYATSA
ncbi:hypothetical protein D7V86_12985 [bacterium D16-51]|nr:hypothetical protein D7V96_05950 [bacterium D16-59]RKI59413.1 hypothetical protein D7V86_12985 [bacterium D16-51]